MRLQRAERLGHRIGLLAGYLDAPAGGAQRVTGLAKGERMDAFVASFSAIGGAKREQVAHLLAAVNAVLEAEGVPALKGIEVRRNVGGASFKPLTWTMELDRDMEELNSDAQLADSLYHEARHAEQAWRVALSLAGPEDTPATLARKVSIDPEIAAQALYVEPAWSEEEAAENYLFAEDFSEVGFEQYQQLEARSLETNLQVDHAMEAFEYRNIVERARFQSDFDTKHAIVRRYGDLLEAIEAAYEAFRAYRETNVEVDAWMLGGAMAARFGARARVSSDQLGEIAGELPSTRELLAELNDAGPRREEEVFDRLLARVMAFGRALDDYKLGPRPEAISFAELEPAAPVLNEPSAEAAEPAVHYVPLPGENRVRIVFEEPSPEPAAAASSQAPAPASAEAAAASSASGAALSSVASAELPAASAAPQPAAAEAASQGPPAEEMAMSEGSFLGGAAFADFGVYEPLGGAAEPVEEAAPPAATPASSAHPPADPADGSGGLEDVPL